METPEQQHTLQSWLPISGLTITRFARSIGVHYATLSEVYRGRRWPDSRTVALIFEGSQGAVSLWDVAFYRANRRVPTLRQAGLRRAS